MSHTAREIRLLVLTAMQTNDDRSRKKAQSFKSQLVRVRITGATDKHQRIGSEAARRPFNKLGKSVTCEGVKSQRRICGVRLQLATVWLSMEQESRARILTEQTRHHCAFKQLNDDKTNDYNNRQYAQAPCCCGLAQRFANELHRRQVRLKLSPRLLLSPEILRWRSLSAVC